MSLAISSAADAPCGSRLAAAVPVSYFNMAMWMEPAASQGPVVDAATTRSQEQVLRSPDVLIPTSYFNVVEALGSKSDPSVVHTARNRAKGGTVPRLHGAAVKKVEGEPNDLSTTAMLPVLLGRRDAHVVKRDHHLTGSVDRRSLSIEGAKELRAIANSGLCSAAMTVVVRVDQAMHPQRAAGGLFLLEHLLDRNGDAGNGDVSDEGQDVIRRFFFDSIPDSNVEIASIERVVQPGLLRRFLARVASEEACVELTFHGTRPEHVDSILKDGLNPSTCLTGAYGRGAYVATHAGIAHQHADPDGYGWRYMCVTLAVTGSRVIRGRERECHNTTTVDRLVNPTEYCVLESDRLCISHLIRYRVTDDERRRVGGGWADPFQTKLNAALCAAAKDRQPTGWR